MNFFISTTNLPNESQSFNWIQTGSDFDKEFSIASKFQLTSNNHRAIACQSGMLVVLPSVDSNLVNVIIKPISSLNIKFQGVKYYVYRNVLKSSFVDSTGAIIPKDPSNSKFIERLWTNWNEYKNLINDQGLPDPSPEAFGYDLNMLDEFDLEEIFDNDHPNISCKEVYEGEWIGNFGHQDSGSNSVPVTFEIILDTTVFNFDYDTTSNVLARKGLTYGYAKELDYIVDVQNMPDSNASDKFNIKVKREEILSYVDPCAFFGMHYNEGISVTEVSATGDMTQNIKKGNDVYTDILSKFSNKNRIYLDIRSEYGSSYNFYENYQDSSGQSLQIKGASSTLYVPQVYNTNKWPLYYANGAFDKVDLKLRVDDNVKPLLLFFDKDRRAGISPKEYILSDDLLEVPAADWTKKIRLKFLKSGSDYLPTVIRMQYCREKDNSLSPSTIMRVADDLDTIFGPFDLPDFGGGSQSYALNNSVYASIAQGQDFMYLSEKCVFPVGDFITFCARPRSVVKESAQVFPKMPSASGDRDVFCSHALFPKDTIVSWSQIDENGVGLVKVANVSAYNNLSKPTKKEHLLLLSMTSTDWNTLRTLADGANITTKHARNIVFSNCQRLTDQNGIPYVKYELKISGLLNDGTFHLTNGSGVFVYTFNNRVFNTKDFGEQKNISEFQTPDPSNLEPWKYYGSWDYDKDVLKSESLHATGFMQVSDKRSNQGADSFDTELRAVVYHPSESSAGTMASGAHPVFAVVHGNGQEYESYRELCKYLAKNGFVAVSLSCEIRNYRVKMVPTAGMSPYTHKLETYRIKMRYCNDATHAKYEELQYYNGAIWKDVTSLEPWSGYFHAYKATISATETHMDFEGNLVAYEGGMGGLGRAHLLVEHLKIVKDKFGASLQNQIAIIGHSRGGEAVVKAADIIANDADLNAKGINSLKSIISLAPTDQYPDPTPEVLTADVPYYVLYGSLDLDVAGYYRFQYTSDKVRTGFSLYDRAKGQEKVMTFVNGATHNGFITKSQDEVGDYLYRRIASVDKPSGMGSSLSDAQGIDLRGRVLDDDTQRNISFGYFNAFARKSIYGEGVWNQLFKGTELPKSNVFNEVHFQHEPKDSEKLIVYRASSSNSSGLTGVSLTYSGTAANKKEGGLREKEGTSIATLQASGISPHDTDGVIIEWENGKQLIIEFDEKDVSQWQNLSFRICNCSRDKVLNNPDVLDSGVFMVGLQDSAIDFTCSIDQAIPPVYKNFDKNDPGKARGYDFNVSPTKNSFITVEVPLIHFTGIDLAKVEKVLFEYNGSSDRKIIIDNVLFTN